MKLSLLLGLVAMLGGAGTSMMALAAAFDPKLSAAWPIAIAAIAVACFVAAHRMMRADVAHTARVSS